MTHKKKKIKSKFTQTQLQIDLAAAYHADLTSQSHLHAGPTTHARKAHRERETWWEREAVVVWWESRWGERGMKRETKGERESEKSRIEK